MSATDDPEDPNGDSVPRKNAENTRGKPFKKGNRGRVPGSRNRTTLAVEALLDGEAEGLTRKAIELAMGGDMGALKLCLDRIAPPKRESSVHVQLDGITGDDVSADVSIVIRAATNGEITLHEAVKLLSLLTTKVKLKQTLDHESRIEQLESRADNLDRRAIHMNSEDRKEYLGALLREEFEKAKLKNKD